MTDILTLADVHAEMKRYNRSVAPGSECNAWQDFVADSYATHKCAPWVDAADDVMPEFTWIAFWVDVARGNMSSRYDAETGASAE